MVEFALINRCRAALAALLATYPPELNSPKTQNNRPTGTTIRRGHVRGSKSSHRSHSKRALTHCYLCGRPLHDPTTKDHCPPRTLFAREILKHHQPVQLDTILVHKSCNESYSRDEEYFKATMVPFARGSVAGDAVYKEFFASSRQQESRLTLAETILREFEQRPSGLHLPPGRVVKRQQGDRIKNVAWKIVRGLQFLHQNVILPESLSVGCSMTAPGRRPPDHFLYVRNLDHVTYGRYPGVFDYFFHAIDLDLGKLNYWAFLIWDRIIITVHFHDAWSCQCEDCTSGVAELRVRMGNVTT